MKKILLTLTLCSLFIVGATAQNSTKQEKRTQKKEQQKTARVEKAAVQAQQNIAKIETLNFTFYPNIVEPEFGLSKNIFSGDYYLTVDKNVMYMSLPYIGRFYIQPVAPEDKAIDLRSSQFLYSVHTDDETTFSVLIAPSDVLNVLNQGIMFNFSLNKSNGSATLKVTANNRQEITYSGYYR